MKKFYSFLCLLLFTGKLFAGDIDVSSLPKFPCLAFAGNEFSDTCDPGLENPITITGKGLTKNPMNLYYKTDTTDVPIIYVGGCGFQSMVGTTSYGQIEIKNSGTATLEIYEYLGPFLIGVVSEESIFKSDELVEQNITPSTPLKIKPQETKTFQIKFTPDYNTHYLDSIVFISNTNKDTEYNNGYKIDSICYLAGWGGQPTDIIITGYDWGRKRIQRLNFPAGPYPAIRNKTHPDTAIKIYNMATAAFTINRLKFTSVIGDSSAFKFNRSDIRYLTLNPGDEVIIPVTFQPTMTGLHLLTFEYETQPRIENLSTTLQGIGIVPRIETQDIDFGASGVNDYFHTVIKQMTIRNLSNAEWQFGDSVTITDLTEININPDISTGTDWSSFTEPFRYDKGCPQLKNAFTSPVVLQPGESITFDGEFVARDYGIFTASLTTVSDSESDVTSNWFGYDSSYVDVEDTQEKEEITIYPNPTSNTFNIPYSIESAYMTNIFITDILGNQTLLKSEYKFPGEYVETYNLNGFSQGIYNIILQKDDKIYSERIVIMK